MSLQLTDRSATLALVFLGFEPEEETDPNKALAGALAEFNLDVEEFLTPATLFACGYHRGLAAASYGDDQIPSNGDGPDSALLIAMEDGYACGLEARDLAKSPPPSLVYEAQKSGDLKLGQMVEWASSIDLSKKHRLAQAVTVGSGGTAMVVPAGTPVDMLDDNVDKDGVQHVIVLWDGLPLLIPNPDDSPRVVSGDTEVAPQKSRRPRKVAEGGTKAQPKAERGPTLRDAILSVMEGKDGGNGPLQSNGQFAGAVVKVCRELGIGDKAGKFLQKADKHVPYYINCYKPGKANEPGRLGVDNPLAWVVAAAEGRKYYLRIDGDHKARMAAVPGELVERMKDREVRITTVEPPKTEPKAKEPASKKKL